MSSVADGLPMVFRSSRLSDAARTGTPSRRWLEPTSLRSAGHLLYVSANVAGQAGRVQPACTCRGCAFSRRTTKALAGSWVQLHVRWVGIENYWPKSQQQGACNDDHECHECAKHHDDGMLPHLQLGAPWSSRGRSVGMVPRMARNRIAPFGRHLALDAFADLRRYRVVGYFGEIDYPDVCHGV